MKHYAINQSQAEILGDLETALNESKTRYNIALSMALASGNVDNVRVVRVLYGEAPSILLESLISESETQTEESNDTNSAGPEPGA